MLALIMLMLTAAPAPVPRAPADAELVTWVPRIERLGDALPFLRQAGERAVVLRPESWREEAHPLLHLDVTSKESVEAAGIDFAGPLTLSRRGDYSWSCVVLSDAKKFTAAADERLKRLGEPFRKDEQGVTIVATKDQLDRVQAAYIVKGRESCALTGHGLSVDKLLPELPKLFARPAAGPGFKAVGELPGVAYFVKPTGTENGALGLVGEKETLRLELKARGLPLAELAGPGTSPYAAFQPAGLAVMRVRFAPAGVGAVLSELTRRMPGGAAVAEAARALGPALTGNMAVYLRSVHVTQGLRTPETRFFALELALLAETSDATKAQALVDGLDAKALQLREGRLFAGVLGTTVFLANNEAVRDAALAALAGAAGKQAHAGELVVDPALVAKGLAQVPLLEAVRTPELAGFLAASTELGPLLLGTKKISGWLDSAGPGATRGQLTWTLPPTSAADAGAPDAGR